MIRQAYIFQVNTAVGDGKLLMNRIVPQEVDVLFVQVRNGKEQGYDSAHAAYHQQGKGNKPPLVFSVIQNLHFNRCWLFVDCCLFWLHITRHLKLGNSCRLNRSGICCRNCKYCLVSICTSSSMVTRMTLLFIILGFPNAPAGLATLTGRMSDAPLSMLMASSTPMFPNEGASTGWLP